MKKKQFFFVFCLVFLGLVTYQYLYKSHRDIASEKAFVHMKANDLILEVQETKALPVQYLNQTIQISGTVTSTSTHEITLDEKLFFQFDQSISRIQQDQQISIKARCLGYDDLLEEVKFDQAILIK